MRSFFEAGHHQTKTFLLYGHLNDQHIGPDMMVTNLEMYLVRLLKSRGYRHVVLYGSEGNRGAYCLDPESSRFFFTANDGIPLPSLPAGAGKGRGCFPGRKGAGSTGIRHAGHRSGSGIRFGGRDKRGGH